MPIVYCDLSCINSKNGECTLDEIDIGEFSCEDFIAEAEPERNDKFYALCIDHEKEKTDGLAPHWQLRMGIKETFREREIFVLYPNDDYFTDGRTGMAGSKSKLEKMTADEFSVKLKNIEELNGLSPLYVKETKFPIKEVLG